MLPANFSTIVNPPSTIFGKASAILFTISPSTTPNSSASASTPPSRKAFPKRCAPAVKSLTNPAISSANTVPKRFPSADVVAFALSIASESVFKLSSISCERINPASSASAPNSSSASTPPRISGFKSCADFPKISIASASRSVSFSICPSARIVSANTSSLSRRLPFASVTETPSAANASAADPVPSRALLICRVSFVKRIHRNVYDIACILEFLQRVRCDPRCF